ncbi:DUF429 domain-containing protein [Haloplasma contractile]|uniref:DUF429 domain-containing protein n=1 Tax=Haloplasma contractile SSD-17B TaxID=1033810 RepID=F7Q1I3_9MOLU|nr:DUF429 domain-containing protein [Haloplasma contractile]ERJ12910.1 hypothetical protein HLPCO_001250 [Haloplasma contractile SSD-17B]
MNTKIIGIDCATDPKKVGLSLGDYKDGNVHLIESELGSTSRKSVAERLRDWINQDDLILIGIDAPLGWPQKLSENLINHHAGEALLCDAHSMFRRFTDQFVKQTLNKQPLDVGADRIARTAHKALEIIDELRNLTNQTISLCWDFDSINSLPGIYLLEVYPAATLTSYHLKNTGYKDKKKTHDRELIVEHLNHHINIQIKTDLLIENADVLDSAICLLAVKDFIYGNVYTPADLSLAKKEGWIWIKRTDF